MKRLLYLALFAFRIFACQTNRKGQNSQDSSDSLKNIRVDITQGGAAIKFDTIYFDLGSLDINGPDQTRDYFFANTGREPLVIEKVETSCSCLEVAYPKDSIAPGTKSKITMTLKMSEISSGQFYRSANVYTNASDEPVEIIMQGIKNYE